MNYNKQQIMEDLSSISDLQKFIGSAHKYVMIINGGILLLYLLYRRDCFFNIFAICNPAPYPLLLGFVVIPLYYIFEAYTMLHYCRASFVNTCKFLIHHIMAISLCYTMFQHSFFNFFTLSTFTAHALTNIGAYYSPNLEYIACRWYAVLSIFSSICYVVILWREKMNKSGVIQMIIIFLTLLYNNVYTPELVEMCQVTENLQLFIREELIHCLIVGVLAIVLKRYSKRKEKVKMSV